MVCRPVKCLVNFGMLGSDGARLRLHVLTLSVGGELRFKGIKASTLWGGMGVDGPSPMLGKASQSCMRETEWCNGIGYFLLAQFMT